MHRTVLLRGQKVHNSLTSVLNNPMYLGIWHTKCIPAENFGQSVTKNPSQTAPIGSLESWGASPLSTCYYI